jgi:DNA-binding transcriptional regulator LsrR (DeoR family)
MQKCSGKYYTRYDTMNMIDQLNTELLGKRIAEFQQRRNLTQEELADRLYVDTSTVGRWTRGERAPTLDNFYRLTRLLGVSMDELVSGSATAKAEPVSIDFRGKPIVSLPRQPRNEEERMGLRIAELWFQEYTRDEIMKQLNIPEESAVRRFLGRVTGDMLLVDAAQVPLSEELAQAVQKTFGLKTCIVADLGSISSMLKTVILGALGAKVIKDLAEKTGVRLSIGFAGGSSCAQVVLSLIKSERLPSFDVMPIAVQVIQNVVAEDANTLVGILGFFSQGTDVFAQGLPFISNADIKRGEHTELHATTREVLEEGSRVSIAFLGLGANLNNFFHQKARSPRKPATFCGKTLFELQQMGCIGDILYNLVSQDGPMPELQGCTDKMVCSIGLDGLQHLARGHSHVIAVAAGKSKSSVARLALRKRYINGLIVDSELAHATLELPAY